jgi:hypothetical protein
MVFGYFFRSETKIPPRRIGRSFGSLHWLYSASG